MCEQERNLTLELSHKLDTELKNALCLDRLIAVTFLELKEYLPAKVIRPVRDMHAHLALCQILRICRTMGLTIGMTIDDLYCMLGASALGFLIPCSA